MLGGRGWCRVQGPYFLFYPTPYTVPARKALENPKLAFPRLPCSTASFTHMLLSIHTLPALEPIQAQLYSHLQEAFPRSQPPCPFPSSLTPVPVHCRMH